MARNEVTKILNPLTGHAERSTQPNGCIYDRVRAVITIAWPPTDNIFAGKSENCLIDFNAV